jgi:hypothetical protein
MKSTLYFKNISGTAKSLGEAKFFKVHQRGEAITSPTFLVARAYFFRLILTAAAV